MATSTQPRVQAEGVEVRQGLLNAYGAFLEKAAFREAGRLREMCGFTDNEVLAVAKKTALRVMEGENAHGHYDERESRGVSLEIIKRFGLDLQEIGITAIRERPYSPNLELVSELIGIDQETKHRIASEIVEKHPLAFSSPRSDLLEWGQLGAEVRMRILRAEYDRKMKDADAPHGGAHCYADAAELAGLGLGKDAEHGALIRWLALDMINKREDRFPKDKLEELGPEGVREAGRIAVRMILERHEGIPWYYRDWEHSGEGINAVLKTSGLQKDDAELMKYLEERRIGQLRFPNLSHISVEPNALGVEMSHVQEFRKVLERRLIEGSVEDLVKISELVPQLVDAEKLRSYPELVSAVDKAYEKLRSSGYGSGLEAMRTLAKLFGNEKVEKEARDLIFELRMEVPRSAFEFAIRERLDEQRVNRAAYAWLKLFGWEDSNRDEWAREALSHLTDEQKRLIALNMLVSGIKDGKVSQRDLQGVMEYQNITPEEIKDKVRETLNLMLGLPESSPPVSLQEINSLINRKIREESVKVDITEMAENLATAAVRLYDFNLASSPEMLVRQTN